MAEGVCKLQPIPEGNLKYSFLRWLWVLYLLLRLTVGTGNFNFGMDIEKLV